MNICKFCGKETKNKSYCSNECKNKYRTKPKGNCLNCGQVLKRVEVKYCSKKCSGEHKKQINEQNKIYNKCIICGKDTLNEKYCSMKCLGKDESRKEICIKNLPNERDWTNDEIQLLKDNYGIVSIKLLEKALDRKEGAIIQFANKHGIQSNRIWTEEQKKYLKNNLTEDIEILMDNLNKTFSSIINQIKRINGYSDNYNSFKTTEDICENLLKELNIDYTSQIQIGKYRTDFYLENICLDIEVQGTYWHSDKRFYPIEKQSEFQKSNIERDKYKKFFLNQLGINILYLWEYDLITNPQYCKELIINEIEKLTKGLPN